MPSNRSTIALLIGTVLMAGCGSLIARKIGVEQWQMAGFAIGILLAGAAPTYDLRRRLNHVENE